MTNDQWLIWQLADSAFPIGSLAHSNGLEAAVQHGVVTDSANLEAFVHAGLGQCVTGVLRFAVATRKAPEDFDRADQQCDLFLNNHVANRASRAQGRALLAASTRIFGNLALLNLTAQVRESNGPVHFPPIFGIVLGSLGISETQTSSLFLFLWVRSTLGSAVRMGVIGPLEAQRIQAGIRITAKLRGDHPMQTTPVLDLLQGTQDRLYSRLFQS
jgi:urease accessory protein